METKETIVFEHQPEFKELMNNRYSVGNAGRRRGGRYMLRVQQGKNVFRTSKGRIIALRVEHWYGCKYPFVNVAAHAGDQTYLHYSNKTGTYYHY